VSEESPSPHGEGPGTSRADSRVPLLVYGLATLTVVALVASVVIVGVQLESSPEASLSSVLLFTQNQGTAGFYAGNFTVPAQSGSNVPVSVDIVAQMSVQCGGPSSYLIGYIDNCTISVVSGPTESLLWAESFTGYGYSNVTLLSPGSYTLLVSVHGGTPPLAVVIIPFSITAEVATVG
jgi:hypothetical protein